MVSGKFSGHLVLVVSTFTSTARSVIVLASHCVVSKQSLYATTHHASQTTPHQLSISIILATCGSHEAERSSMKSTRQGSSTQGVGAPDGDELGSDSVGRRVGRGVGSGVGLGVGKGVGLDVGLGVGSGVGLTLASAIGGLVGWGVGSGVGLGVGPGLGKGVGRSVGWGV